MWYTASVLLEGDHQIEPALPSRWEEVIVLIEAESEEDARLAAESIGRSKEHEYYASAPKRHLVRWTFARVERVCAIEEPTLKSGTELFSRFLRQNEVESLLTPFEDSQTKAI